MLRFKVLYTMRIAFFAIAILMLPTLGGCSGGGGNPVVPGTSDYGRDVYFEQMPGAKHFTILPIGPAWMFTPDGYLPICETTSPTFVVKIFAPTDGPMAKEVDVDVTTVIDGEKVGNSFDPVTGNVKFSPSKQLESGPHTALVQLTIENNAYPPVVKQWIFNVYDEPPEITTTIWSEKEELLVVLFNRPVPESQIIDMGRWTVDSNEFALDIKAHGDLMGVKINIGQNLHHLKNLPGTVTLEFNSDLGWTTYILISNNCERGGSRTAQEYPDCSRVDETNWTSYPGSGNPHHFLESEYSAWCYKLEMEADHCPVAGYFTNYQHGNLEHIYAWDETLPDCNYFCDADEPSTPLIEEFAGAFGTEPACYDDDSCYYHTLTFASSSFTSFSAEVRADNLPPEEPDGVLDTDVGTASGSFPPDTNNPHISLGPFIVTGWQAAREIEGLISDPGDSVFHYGLPYPPTVEEYIELLRTEWADRIFVLAGGTDPGGNLFPYTPLDLDTWSPIQTCPPMECMALGFLLIRDHYPLGALPGGCCGDETIPWPDTRSYPVGYPVDGCAYYEEEYALWDITGYVDNICEENDFSMRVCVTDHVGNWQRSGFIEDMQVGVPGVDKGIVDIRFYSDSDGFPDYLFNYCDNDCDDPQSCHPYNTEASAITIRDHDGDCMLHLVAVYLFAETTPPATQTAFISSDEQNFPSGADVNESLEVEMNLIEDAPENQEIITRFNDLFAYEPAVIGCTLGYYICQFTVTDTPEQSKLYISHDDDAYDDYPESDICRDYTFIADIRPEEPNQENYVDCTEVKDYYSYGTKRGWDIENCDPSKESYYAEDRLIQVGGFHIVTATIEGAKTPTGEDIKAHQAVQSAADLIIISSHGYVGPDEAPMGILCIFSGRTGGCECPPYPDPFRDSTNFSPLSSTGCAPGYDNDFEDNAYDNGDFDGDFWQQQTSHDSVTWVLFLGCDIFSDDGRIGYSPRQKWIQHIGNADVLCGYSSFYISHPAFDAIGGLFTELMENALLNGEMPPPANVGLYINEEIIPGGYDYRPVRAWMESNCFMANQPQFKNPESLNQNAVKDCITSAIAIDMEMKVWFIDDPDEDSVYNIFVQ